MAKVSREQWYKTTERQREASERTRSARKKARSPQARDVDEALSAAMASVSRRILREDKAARDAGSCVEMVMPRQITDWLLDATISHLVDIRGMDRSKSRSALQDRLKKSRRYQS